MPNITHDLATAYYISDYIAVMNHGSIVEFGKAGAFRPAARIYTSPARFYSYNSKEMGARRGMK
jgi:ABC-type dipeptide/oligopeptide/nickel transport system ATPase component